jgi:hypothetical protein
MYPSEYNNSMNHSGTQHWVDPNPTKKTHGTVVMTRNPKGKKGARRGATQLSRTPSVNAVLLSSAMIADAAVTSAEGNSSRLAEVLRMGEEALQEIKDSIAARSYGHRQQFQQQQQKQPLQESEVPVVDIETLRAQRAAVQAQFRAPAALNSPIEHPKSSKRAQQVLSVPLSQLVAAEQALKAQKRYKQASQESERASSVSVPPMANNAMKASYPVPAPDSQKNVEVLEKLLAHLMAPKPTAWENPRSAQIPSGPHVGNWGFPNQCWPRESLPSRASFDSIATSQSSHSLNDIYDDRQSRATVASVAKSEPLTPINEADDGFDGDWWKPFPMPSEVSDADWMPFPMPSQTSEIEEAARFSRTSSIEC